MMLGGRQEPDHIVPFRVLKGSLNLILLNNRKSTEVFKQ